MEKGKLYVVLGYSARKKQVVAYVKQDNVPIKTKTIGFKRSGNFDTSYNQILIEAKKLAKDYNAEFIPKTKEQLKNNRIGTQSKNPNTEKSNQNKSNQKCIVVENPLIEKFGNELLFKAMIRHAIKTHGTEKTSEVLKNALLLVQEVEHKQKRDQQLISTANLEMARIVLNTRKQGLDMDAPNKDIEAAVQWLMDNESSVKSPRQSAANASYMLNGEPWNGKGHAPASYAKFLRENEDKTLDDLRVS